MSKKVLSYFYSAVRLCSYWLPVETPALIRLLEQETAVPMVDQGTRFT